MKMTYDYPIRECPICESKRRRILFRQKFENLSSVSLLHGYDVVVCNDCGFVFADRIPGKSEFDTYYSYSSKYEFNHHGGKQHKEEIMRLSDLADWVSQKVPRMSRIIDVGCATGELLAQLKEKGFSDLVGIDPSPQCVEYVRKNHGIRMIEGVLGQKPEDEPNFDLLILSAVIEHIPDLIPFLHLTIKYISIGGYLVIEVPDAESFAKGSNAPFQEFSVEHINFFSSASLINLMGRLGYSPIAERKSICQIGSMASSSITTMLFRLGSEERIPIKEGLSEKGVVDYITLCESSVKEENDFIRALIKTRRSLLVWGTGTVCQRLLATTELGKANIRAFVDSNPHYQGETLAGRSIIAPLELARYDDAILILSVTFFEEIRSQIRMELKLQNEIIGLPRTI